jgi:hypothetical protein
LKNAFAHGPFLAASGALEKVGFWLLVGYNQ